MKKNLFKVALVLITCTFSLATLWGQSPERLSYQAVVRNASGELITNQNIGVRVQILHGSEFGAAVFVETHTRLTNANGLVTLEIGGGTVVQGSFSNINWDSRPFFLKTEIDPTGGSSYSINGVTQLLSVPYALYAKSAAPYVHSHSAVDITSGTLPVARGGTGAVSFTSGNVLIGNGTGAITALPRSGIDNRAAFPPSEHNHAATEITSGTLAVDRGGTGISSYTTGNYLRASGAKSLEQRTPMQVRSDIGAGTVSSIATGNGITGGTITTTGTLGLTGQALALHNLSSNGFIVRTGSGTVAARSLTAGSGITIVNGDGVGSNPQIRANIGMDWTYISVTNVNVRPNAINVGSVGVTAPKAGYIVVRFDGQAYASTGDYLVLAASNTSQTWGVNDGNVGFMGDNNSHPFSHTRVYSVSAGTHTFYAVAQNYVNTSGTGRASIYATLTAVFYPSRY